MTQTVSLRSILVNVGALLSGSVVARILSAAAIILTARWLGPDVFGQYAACLALTSILAVFFSLGLEGWLLQSGGKDGRLLGSKASASLLIQSGLGIAWLIVLTMVAPLLDQDTFPANIFILCALAVYFETLTLTATNGFKAVLKNNITFGLLIGSQGILLLLTIMLVGRETPDVELFVSARILASILGAAVAIALLFYRYGFTVQQAVVKQALRETPAFGASAGLSLLAKEADVTIVAHFLGKTAAGLYAPAVTVASTLFLAPDAIFGVMVPIISRTYTRSQQLAKALSQRLLLVMVGLGFVAGILLTFVARPMIQLFYGPEYSTTGRILMILGGVLFFRFTTYGAGAVLVGIGWQNRRLIVQVAAVLINIVLNILIVQQWGLDGVAAVYVFTEALLSAGYLLYVRAWMRTVPGEPSAVQLKP